MHTLSLPDVELAYDVDGPLPPVDGRPVVVVIGQPMTADGFAALAGALVGGPAARTVVRYDPRGLGRSTRSDGLDTSVPETQAADLHALVGALDAGPVDVFASSGGAVAGLAWVAAHPGDVRTLVAHEPPLFDVLPDATAARRAAQRSADAYAERGFGAGMAEFVTMVSWAGPFTDAYLRRPPADPAAFGFPTGDDGTRDDPLLSGRADAVSDHVPDPAVLAAAPARVVVAVGEESREQWPGRSADALAALLGAPAVVFPSHHGGFGAEDGPYPGRATAFAARLVQVLDDGTEGTAPVRGG